MTNTGTRPETNSTKLKQIRWKETTVTTQRVALDCRRRRRSLHTEGSYKYILLTAQNEKHTEILREKPLG
jgi:hypothetical protein